MSYSKQLIAEISDHISPELKDFFELKKNILAFPTTTIQQAVEMAMDFYLKGEMLRENISTQITTIKKSRNRKRARWYVNFQNDSKLSLEDKKHPFASLILLARTAGTTDYRRMFGEKELDEILEEEKEKVAIWAKDIDGWLISYPCISSFTSGSIYKTFLSDLIIDIWRYLQESLGGNIASYTAKFPEDLIPLPIFSARQFIPDMNQEGELLKDTVYDEEGKSILSLTVNPLEAKSNPIKTMDATDRAIFSTILTRIPNSFYLDRKVVIPVSDLTKSVTGRSKCNEAEKARVKQRLQKFTDFSYSYKEGNKLVAFNFFDNIVVDEGASGEQIATVTFGEVIHSSVVEQKLISVVSGEMRALENKLSQVLFFMIQRERITAAQKGQLDGMVSYSSFLQSARFPTSSKKKNKKEIQTALDDFVAKNIVIDSYSVDGDIFHIHFRPLTDEEMEDLNLENNRWTL